MAKTFEALTKAVKENQLAPEEAKIFDLKPKAKSVSHTSVTFKAYPQVIEEYHRMKQTILSTNSREKINILLFTSSTNGEGTSTVLINFSLTLAAGGDKVLVVDANHRNPSLHDLLNVEKKGGLTELLQGEYPIKSVLKKTQIKNLSVITSGLTLANPSSLFETGLSDYLIAQIKTQADWVLFDSPPINIYNDSCSLADKMDGIVLVIEAEKTRWEVAQSARRRIENGKAKILGVILNRRKMHIPELVYRML